MQRENEMDVSEYNHMVRGWVENVLQNRGVDAGKTMENCDMIMEYGVRTNDDKLIGFAYFYKAETYYMLNEVDDLFLNMTKALEYLQRAQVWEETTSAYNILAIASINRGNAPFAMDYYLNALNYAKKYNYYEMQCIINMNIGNLFSTYGAYTHALKCYEESHEILKRDEELRCKKKMYSVMIYISMANCYLRRDMIQRAWELKDMALKEVDDSFGDIDHIFVKCFQARLYNKMERSEERDACIAQIEGMLTENMTVLEIFEDLYAYCEMLLEISKYEAMWKVLNIMEKMVKKANIINLERKIVSLKIKYYKITNDKSGFLQASGFYYEICEMSEKENMSMIYNMLNVRVSLEEVKKRQKETEYENEYLHRKSETDALTGLANRYRFSKQAERSFSKTYEEQRYLTIEMLDIDYFKQYNDNYGHQAGDNCIRVVAQCIRQLEEHGHIFTARYGGDEFIIIYEGYTLQEVKGFARELRKNIMAQAISHEYSLAENVVTISQGLCCDIPGEDSKLWDFMHTADEMLYEGKKKTRNSICAGNLSEESELV